MTSLKWFPSVVSITEWILMKRKISSYLKFDEKSDGILVGFSDGVIRYLKLRSGIKPNGTEKKFELDLRMIQAL